MTRFAVLFALVAACHHPSTTTTSPTHVTPTARDQLGIEWTLTTSASPVAVADLVHFEIAIAATNTGGDTIDPQYMGCVEASEPCLASGWKLDGAESMALNLTFGNGGREARWRALPPGDTVTDRRIMGDSLELAPGDHTISFDHGEARVEVTVTVTP